MNLPSLILLAALLTLSARAADPLSEALQRGLLAEEAQKDLSAASTAYQEAVRLADAQRSLAATALFRWAEVQRKLGQTNDAAVAYERLLREFPEQTNLTVLAERHVPSKAPFLAIQSLPQIQAAVNLAMAELKQLSDTQVELAGLRKRFEAQRQAGNWIELGQDMAAAAPTPELTRLRSERNKAEVQLASLSVNFGPKHPDRLQVAARIAKIDEQIQAELNLIGRDLEARDATLNSRLDQQRLRVQTLSAQLNSRAPAVPGEASADESSESRRLLLEEIALAEQQLEISKKKLEAGRGEAEEVLKASRDILTLKRQLAAMSAPQAIPTGTAVEPDDEEAREIARLQRMLANSPDLLNAPQGSENETPLQTAASKDQARVVEYLLKSGADINVTGPSGLTALYKAASAGHKRMVDLLLRAGAQVDARGEAKFTPLLGAVAKERSQVIQLLLAAGASPNKQCGNYGIASRIGTKTHVSPLGLAMLLGDRALVEQMIRGGADINAPCVEDQSPIEVARNRRDWEMVARLLELGVNLNLGKDTGKLTPLETLVLSTDVPTAILDQVLARGGQLSVTNASGDTLLHLAIRFGATNAVPWLLAHGVEPDAVNREGMTPLMTLIAMLNSDSLSPTAPPIPILEKQLELLLTQKVDVNRAHPSNGAMLGWNLWSPNTNVFLRLLAAGADPNTVDKDGAPLLRRLTRYPFQTGNYKELEPMALAKARALLQAGTDPNLTWYGTSTLNAALASSPELVKLLLEFKANPNLRDGAARTALEELTVIRESSNSSGVLTRSKETLAQLEALLRSAGARDNVPNFSGISLKRPSSGFTQVIFRRNGTNDANRFTLLEALAVHYKLLRSPAAPSIPSEGQSQAQPSGSALPFPDWKRVVLRRADPDGMSWKEIPVDVTQIFAEGGCGRDVPLQWGDVLEIPERDHLIGETDFSPPPELFHAWQTCLSRSVTFTVGGKSESRRQEILKGNPTSGGQDPFTLQGAVIGSRLLRTSSDTSRVLLRRPDTTPGTTNEFSVDLREADGKGRSLWLREGDEIVVPDLR